MKIKAIYQRYSENYLVDTDTRNIRKNTIFFGLKGANFNGNIFAEKALQLGASYAVIDEKEYQTNDCILLVDDVLKTLQELAKFHRNELKIPIIGLTGSNGKTTTKELINAVLEKKYKTVATKGNLNNHIGVPLTLLSMTPETEIGIVEMGANHQKEIAFLCEICQPDFGHITNFGKAHLEGFGSLEGVIKGKTELYSYLLKGKKKAFINPEDSIQIKKSAGIDCLFFNKNTTLVEASPFVKVAVNTTEIKSNLVGKYNFSNILAAITIGEYFKVSKEAIKNAIENYVSDNNRSQIIETASNKIILDAYNANPTSMKAALENFNLIKSSAKTVILGDMFELGKESEKEHQEIANLATSFSFENVFLVGKNFNKTNTKAFRFKSFENLQKHLQNTVLQRQLVLIKGSRGMQLERIVENIN